MTERLKGSVEFGATIPTGPYKNVKVVFIQEFYLDLHTHEDILATLAYKVDEAIAKLRTPEIQR